MPIKSLKINLSIQYRDVFLYGARYNEEILQEDQFDLLENFKNKYFLGIHEKFKETLFDDYQFNDDFKKEFNKYKDLI